MRTVVLAAATLIDQPPLSGVIGGQGTGSAYARIFERMHALPALYTI